jgi:hypothetical protein
MDIVPVKECRIPTGIVSAADGEGDPDTPAEVLSLFAHPPRKAVSAIVAAKASANPFLVFFMCSTPISIFSYIANYKSAKDECQYT